MEAPKPFDQFWCTAIDTGSSSNSDLICAASDPTTTTIGAHPESFAATTIRLTNVLPWKMASCFGLPKRAEPPAATTTAATFIGRLCGLSAGGRGRGMNIGRTFSEKSTGATGQHGCNFGHNRQP